MQIEKQSQILRRTKIVATLGPATDSDEVLTGMIENGLNVVRLNFSHGAHEEQIERVERVRRLAEKCGRVVGILVDLQGPKIRIAKFKDNKIPLTVGGDFTIDCGLDESAGTVNSVGVAYKTLHEEVKVGDELLLDDGAVEMKVDSIDGQKIHCKVIFGDELSNNKGLNLRGGGLSADALTVKDKEDIIVAGSLSVRVIVIV